MKPKPLVLKLLAALLMLPVSASALVMLENGPEPIIVQIRESLRLSDDLDNQLNALAAVRRENRLTVEKWWAGNKLLVKVSFPAGATRQEAVSAIEDLQRTPAVEKVVVASAQNLEFNPADFAREYEADQHLPEAARRGLDRDEVSRPAYRLPDQLDLLHTPHVPDRLVVRWKGEHMWRAERTGFINRIATFNRDARCRVAREVRHSELDFVQVLESEDVSLLADKLKKYMTSGLVLYAQPDYLYTTTAMPNDPFYGNAPGPQWNLSQISAPQAWDLSIGSDSVIIAVGDTGANVYHSDIATNRWSGQTTSNTNRFSNNSSVSDGDGAPSYGHGMNVASIVGASGNNGQYMTGVAWEVSLMHLKLFGTTAGVWGAPSSVVASGIDFARTKNVTAMNLSVGRYAVDCDYNAETGQQENCRNAYDGVIFDALRRARGSNMAVVCAAGNDAVNTDYSLVSPASIPTDNVISVLATNAADYRAGSSNYGAQTVDLAAPGGENGGALIVGLANSSNHSAFAGTSQAAPHVSGALALIKSRFPWEDYIGLRDRVLMGTDRTGTVEGLSRTNGRLNLHKALQTRSMIRNLSTRARVEDGERIMIGGFVIGGSPGAGPLKVAIRGLGPSVGVSVPRLGNPKIELYNSSGTLIDWNHNWWEHSSAWEIDALDLEPGGNEAAMIHWLNPGAYTVHVRDEGNQYGVGMFEIYELQGNSNEQSRLRNLSTRCMVGTGEEEAIAGTIVGDLNNTGLPKPSRRLLMFAKGPSLHGVSYRLWDPEIQVLNTGEFNNNWQEALGWRIGEELAEAQRAPADGREGGLWPTFQPGSYTIAMRGWAQSTGIGLIELYEY